MDFGEVIGFGVEGMPSFWIGPLAAGEDNREVHVAFQAPRPRRGPSLLRRRGRDRRRGAPRAPRLARVPPRLLRRVRARSRRQQHRGGVPPPRVSAGQADGERRTTIWCAAARAVLDRNRRGAWTCPSLRLYPHQWLWDSCFTAIGIARFDPARAAGELRALFRGQWANGMLPHMIFAAGIARPRQPRASGARAATPTRPATSTPPASPSRRSSRSRSSGSAQALPSRRAPRVPRRAAAQARRPTTAWLYRERDLDRHRARHAHPPVGVRARLDAAVDARAAPNARCRGGCAAPSGSTSRASCAASATTRATSRPPSAPPTTTACACSRSPSTLERYGFELRRTPAPTACVLIEDVAFNAILAVANRALHDIADEVGSRSRRSRRRSARTARALEHAVGRRRRAVLLARRS